MDFKIATATNSEGLRALLNDRRIELKLTMLELDDLTGLPDGYCSTLLCGGRGFGKLSLGLMLQALGCTVAVVPSSAGKALNACEIGSLKDGLRSTRIREIARLGGLARRAKASEDEWRAFSAAGGHARAKKIRQRKSAYMLTMRMNAKRRAT